MYWCIVLIINIQNTNPECLNSLCNASLKGWKIQSAGSIVELVVTGDPFVRVGWKLVVLWMPHNKFWKVPSLKLTASLHPKIDGWKMLHFLLGEKALFSGAFAVSVREGIFVEILFFLGGAFERIEFFTPPYGAKCRVPKFRPQKRSSTVFGYCFAWRDCGSFRRVLGCEVPQIYWYAHTHTYICTCANPCACTEMQVCRYAHMHL